MASIGLSVPPGFTISTEACQEYQQIGKKLPDGLWEEVLQGLLFVENEMGANLGDPAKPLLLSVRSGAAVGALGFGFFCVLVKCLNPGSLLEFGVTFICKRPKEIIKTTNKQKLYFDIDIGSQMMEQHARKSTRLSLALIKLEL